MAFAVKLWARRFAIGKCVRFFSDEFKEKRQVLLDLLHACGYKSQGPIWNLKSIKGRGFTWKGYQKLPVRFFPFSMSHKNRGKTWEPKKFCLVFSFYFLFTYKNLSLYRKRNLSHTDLHSNTLGEVEPCGCPEGEITEGYPKGLTILKTVKAEVKNLSFLRRRGMHWSSVIYQPSEREKARKKRAEFVLRLYETLGYHCPHIGDTDLGLELNI